MTINFTPADVIGAAEAAWAAIQHYSKQHGVCADCLGMYVIADMLFHVVKNGVADEQLPAYRTELDAIWDTALAARNGRPAKPGLH